MSEEEICIGRRSGKTYNKIQEMEKEIVKLEKENAKYIRIFNETEKIMNKQERAIDKLEKENEELKEELEKANKQLDLDYVDNNFISKDEIKQIIGYEENEDVSRDAIISLLKTMWEEFNRLEDLEDYMATQCISKKK